MTDPELAITGEDPEAVASDDSVGLVYDTLEQFVADHLAGMYRRQVTDSTAHIWCPYWFKHAEAVARLDILWHTWEDSRRGTHADAGMWWHEADYHMGILLDPEGPFKGCSVRRGHAKPEFVIPALPVEPAADGAFTAAHTEYRDTE